MTSKTPTSILFVCLGNICRSPMAEAIFTQLVVDAGFEDRFIIDSCGTGSWHIGAEPHHGTQAVLVKNKVPLLSHSRARQISRSDFSQFQHIVCMDRSNLEDVLALGGDEKQVYCLRGHDLQARGDLDVPDPYYGPGDGFDRVYEIVKRSCEELFLGIGKGTSDS